MAQNEPQGVSSLPLPPMKYVNLYTDENVRKGSVPRPPFIPNNTYTVFSVNYEPDEEVLIRPLEGQGIRRLHPSRFDHKKELKKLNHSILINFLELLDILVNQPASSKREEKLEDLNLLFIHIHHLINEFRPHQARETLRVMMEMQKRQRTEVSERLQRHLEKVSEILKECLASLPDVEQVERKVIHRTEQKAKAAAARAKEKEKNEKTETDRDKMMCGLVDGI